MRFIQSNISAISNRIANQGIQLIVRAGAAASRVAASFHALIYGASHLVREMGMSPGQEPSLTWGPTSRLWMSPVKTVTCFVVTKHQRQLGLDTRCRTLA